MPDLQLSDDDEYVALHMPSDNGRSQRRVCLTLLVATALATTSMGAAVTIVPGFHGRYDREASVAALTAAPTACGGWELRCRTGAAMAAAQGLGRFWDAALCDEAAKAKLSCANRARVWASPSLTLQPDLPAPGGSKNREALPDGDSALVLFLPGTGTMPEQAVRAAPQPAPRRAHADLGTHPCGSARCSSRRPTWASTCSG